ERDDVVLERLRSGIARDRLDLSQLLGHAGVEGRSEMTVVDEVELRVLQRQRTLDEKGIGRFGGHALARHDDSGDDGCCVSTEDAHVTAGIDRVAGRLSQYRRAAAKLTVERTSRRGPGSHLP